MSYAPRIPDPLRAMTAVVLWTVITASTAHSAEKGDDDWGDEPAAKAARVAPVESPSIYGSTGLLRVAVAGAARAGAFRFQVLGEYFRATQFLAASPYDTNRRVGGRFGVAYAPRPWFEAFLMVSGQSNDNTRATPTTENLFGDVTLGVKGCVRIGRALCLGAEAAAIFLSGVGPVGYTADATSARLRALGSVDVGALSPRVPMRVHFNAGAIVDNSRALLRPQDDQLTRFALRLNESHRAIVGVGLDAPLNAHVTPFIEWGLEIPLGSLPSTTRPQGFAAFPNIASAGARLAPWSWLTLLVALDVGLTARAQLGLPAVPPWQAFFALAFAVDVGARR